MICSKCGKDNPDGVVYCAQCGAEISVPAPRAPVPGPGGPVPPQQQWAGQPTTNGMAIASLILGIVGLCTCIAGVPGLILGIVALNQIKASRGQQTGGGLAVAGIITSIAGIILSLGMVIAWFVYYWRSVPP